MTKRLLEFFVDQGLFVNMLTVFIIFAGILTLIRMPREIFPNVSFDIVLVTTVYPGATALEVENLVTNVVEDHLREVDGLKEVWGTSIEHTSMITLILDPNASDKAKVVDDVKAAIDRIVDLPEAVDPPVVTEMESKNQPILEVVLNGELPYSDLRKTAFELTQKLEEVPGIARVEKRGYFNQEIWVEADPILLHNYHVSLTEINQSIAENNVSVPGGILKQSGHDIVIRTAEQVSGAQDIANIVIRKSYQGNDVRISDVATVRDAFEDQKLLYRTNGKRGINLQVIKKEKLDAIHLVAAIRQVVQDYSKQVDPGIHIQVVNDYSYFLTRRLNIIKNNGMVAVGLVLLILFLFLNHWVALWTAAAIPLSIAIAISIGAFFGITINLISLLALLVVLGVVVDDSIVVGENIFRHLENGLSPKEAARKGLLEVARPVTATILTTIAAFTPLLFMPGIMGKFIWAIPAVIILSLIGSWFESFTILPNHMSDLIPKRNLEKIRHSPKNNGGQHWLMTPIQNFYTRVLSQVLKHRYPVLGGASVLLTLSIILAKTGVLPFILFESRGIEMFFVRVEGPTTASIERTEQELVGIEQAILEEIHPNELEFISTTVGRTSQDANDPFRVTSSHVGQILVRITPESQRDRDFETIVAAVRQRIGDLPPTPYKVKFDRLRPGPPVGKPLSIQILGPDLQELKRLADQLQSEISKIDGVSDLTHTLIPGKDEWVVKIDKANAASLNVALPQVALAIQSAFDGFISTSIRTVDEEIEIRTRLKADTRIPDEAIVKALTVPNRTGQLIPLDRLISINPQQGYVSVLHSEWQRYAMVGGQVDEKKTTSVAINNLIQKKYKNFGQEHPGYQLKFRGEFQETQESFTDLRKMFVIAFALVFLIMAITFQSLLQPFLIMFCVPFAFVGVCFAFLLHGYPLGFLAMIGIIGLLGVVVNDSIVFTDFINKSLRSGKTVTSAILEAGSQRIRPILLTSLTTIFGLLPTAYGIGGYDPFLVPLCLSFAWGLAFATCISLFLLPCLFMITDDLKRHALSLTHKVKR